MSLVKVVAGRYRVVKHARSGGMGEVFLCFDTRTSRQVAVKVLATADETLVERFLREAELLAELDVPQSSST